MESTVWGVDLSYMGEELIVRRASAPGDITFFSVTDDTTGQVVSAAWIVYHPGTDFAYLAGGSTLEAWRKRGIYRALVAVRARQAAMRGTRYLTVDASDDSSPILRRLGFQAVTTTTPTCGRRPPPTSAANASPRAWRHRRAGRRIIRAFRGLSLEHLR